LWHSVLRRRCSPNGVFGLKAFPQQMDELEDKNPQLLEEVLGLFLSRQRPRHVIYLRRRDRVAQAVSYARADLSGVWHRKQESAASAKIEYSQQALESAERGIELLEGVWARMFQDLQIEPLNLWHEDVLANPSEASRRVADYLGARIDPAAAVDVPEVLKQSEGDSPKWIERYASSRSTRSQSSSS
jgi:LPS sulfotransferase NodH